MKKLLLTLTLALLLFFCDNGDVNEEQDTTPFSLIGTWETSGDYVVNGDQRTYNGTLTFISETEYKKETAFKSKNGTWSLNGKNDGTYVYDESNITYTDTYYKADGSKGGTYTYKMPYKIINKNTIEAESPGVSDRVYIFSVTFKRK